MRHTFSRHGFAKRVRDNWKKSHRGAEECRRRRGPRCEIRRYFDESGGTTPPINSKTFRHFVGSLGLAGHASEVRASVLLRDNQVVNMDNY